MPLPNDDKLIALANDVLGQFDTIFGEHPGFRPAHAKGTMLTGTFTPATDAYLLAKAPHLERPSTPVTVRFSDSTGLPVIPDNDPNASPRGMAVRFHLAERVHTDLVMHSTDGFPTRTPAEFLEMLRAIASGGIQAFLGSHPKALAFVQTPKPFPSSFARETYFGVTALRFTNAQGLSRFGRCRIVPEAGSDYLSESAAAAMGPAFLFDELAARIAAGPIGFRLQVQIAEDSDVVDDATVHWPESRNMIDLGRISLAAAVANDAAEQKHIIFDPIPRVDGIAPSDDPLLQLRAAIYLISGRRRRAAQVMAAGS